MEDALRRELHEELGITIAAAQPWQVLMMDYPHARVRLNFCKVFAWRGEFERFGVDVLTIVPGMTNSGFQNEVHTQIVVQAERATTDRGSCGGGARATKEMRE